MTPSWTQPRRESPSAPVVTAVVMAFDEAPSIEATVHEISVALRELRQPSEILIVDDGSTDGTGAIADRLAAALPHVRVIHHEDNRGLGGVYRTGFAHARGDHVTFFPADGQFPASIIPQFVRSMKHADMVLGYLPSRRDSLLARTLSRLERILYRLLLGPLPRFQGILMFRRTLLSEIELKSTGRGWGVLMELIVRVSRGGYRAISLPTGVRPRTSGVSKVNNVRTIWANTAQLLRLRTLLATRMPHHAPPHQLPVQPRRRMRRVTRRQRGSVP